MPRWSVALVIVASHALAQATVTPVATQMDPTPRRSTGFAADATGSFWAFGGFVGGSGAAATLWKQLPSGQWLALAPTGGAPPAREQHGLGVHPASQAVVMFGGFASTAAGLDDTWLMTGTQWVGPFSPATRPGPRGGVVFSYDPARDRFLSFGGTSNAFVGGSRSNETWSLDVSDGGVTWVRLTVTGPPTIRNASCGAVDPVHDRLIIFGGEAGAGGNPNGETWSLDLQTLAWRNDSPTGAPPSARSYCVAAWDSASGRLLLYGGQGSSNPIGGAFAYDPVARAWADVTPTSNVGVRSDASGAPHPQGGIVFFAGRTGSTSYTSQTVRFTFDAGVDAGLDAGVDAGLDAGVDAGLDAGVDAGLDAGVDAGLDAGVDAGFDAGVPDASVDAGVVDAGPLADAGQGDAGEPRDAGGGEDAGAPADAGAGADGGAREDAGFDAGNPADAGAEGEDGGPDAGPVRVSYTVGCGCTGGPMELLVLGLVLLCRRRPGPRGPT